MKDTKIKLRIALAAIAILIIGMFLYVKSQDNFTESDSRYTKVSINQMIKDLHENGVKASEKYKEKDISMAGKIDSISPDGKYITIKPSFQLINFDFIICEINDNESRERLKGLSSGDRVILKGHVININNIGYTLRTEEIVKK